MRGTQHRSLSLRGACDFGCAIMTCEFTVARHPTFLSFPALHFSLLLSRNTHTVLLLRRSSFSCTTPLSPYELLHPSSLSLFIIHLSSRATILRTRPWLSPAFRGQTRFSLSQLSQQHDLGGGSVPAPSCGSPGVAGRGEGESPASRTKGFKIRLVVVEKPEVVTERSYPSRSHYSSLKTNSRRAVPARR